LRHDQRVLRRLFAVCFLVAVVAPASAAAPGNATLATFAGSWIGHTRVLTISRSGVAKENVNDGCCDHVIALSLRLSHPAGTSSNATATVTATSVHVYDATEFSKSYPAPRVGETGKLTLRHGVILDSLTRDNYCDQAVDTHGACGA
jgi:hypothetical protein